MDIACWEAVDQLEKTVEVLFYLSQRPSLVDYRQTLASTVKQVRVNIRMFREINDLAIIHYDRQELAWGWLDMVLPCMKRTMSDIKWKLADESVEGWKRKWQKLHFEMEEEAGVSLKGRFEIYGLILVQIARLLSRPDLYDPMSVRWPIEVLREIRRMRNIEGRFTLPAEPVFNDPLPVSTESDLGPTYEGLIYQAPHWAELVFENPPQQEQLGTSSKPSKCHGPAMYTHKLGIPETSARVIFKQHYNQAQLSLTCFCPSEAPTKTRLLVRWHEHGEANYSSFGTNELCIKRKKKGVLFTRYKILGTDDDGNPVGQVRHWAFVGFKCWRKLVLFHETFLALKANNPQTQLIHDDEFDVSKREKCLFREEILDNGFLHTLSLYSSLTTTSAAYRLSATVTPSGSTEEVLHHTPVWTAFIDPAALRPRADGRSKVRIKGIEDVFVFCGDYEVQAQRRGRASEWWEIEFCRDKSVDKFLRAVDKLT